METHVPSQTLETLIAFRTVAGNRTQKDACLDWIYRNFMDEAGILATHFPLARMVAGTFTALRASASRIMERRLGRLYCC